MKRSSSSYYYRRRSPFRAVIVVLLVLGFAGGAYWYYTNFFKSYSRNDAVVRPGDAEVFGTETQDGVTLVSSGTVTARTGDTDTMLHVGAHLFDRTTVSTGTERAAFVFGSETFFLNETSSVVVDPTDEKIVFTAISGESAVRSTDTAPIETRIGVPEEAVYRPITVSGLYYGIKFISPSAVEVVALGGTAVVRISDTAGVVVEQRLDLHERAVITYTATKFNLLRIYDFDARLLNTSDWYVWVASFKAETSEPTPIIGETSGNAVLPLTVALVDEGRVLQWTPYDQPNFKRYEILRSYTQASPQYGVADSLSSSTARSLHSFTDTNADQTKTAYYRICVITLGEEIICGAVVQIAPSITEEPVTDDAVTAEESASPVVQSPPALSAAVTPGGIVLAWTTFNADLDAYLILRSQDNPAPGVEHSIDTTDATSYTDVSVGELSPGSYYYRVCAKTQVSDLACSNVVRVEDGAVR